MAKTKIDTMLEEELNKIREEESFVQFIFDYCETQDERERLLQFILSGHHERKEVLLMASQIAIEDGTSEGELIDE